MKTALSHFPRTGRFVAAAVLATCLVGGYLGIRSAGPAHARIPAASENVAASGPQLVRPGWWETEKRIYFDIPARVRFRSGTDGVKAGQIAEQVWAEFDRIGRIFNPYAPDSEIARLNAADITRPVPVSADLWRVLQLSRTLWRASDGAFDPTMLPIKRLWREAVEDQQIPSTRMVRGTLSRVGFGKVRFLERQRAIESDVSGIQFDFGGVAKGYAVDRVVALLQENGIPAGLVQLGGEIAAFGQNDHTAWRIGIQHPTDPAAAWGVLTSRSGIRVSTSGNYEQPLIIAGHRFYHIFSPKTGMPVSEKILGVTTADFSGAATSALLDGAATAITVMGSEAGMQMAKALGIETLVLKETGKAPAERMTDGFRKHYARRAPEPTGDAETR